MPLPAPPPLKRARHVKKALRLLVPLEERPLTFPELEEVLYDKDIRKQTSLRCRTCLKFQRCTLGPQQMLQCFAHFLWHPKISTNPHREQDADALVRVPLTEEDLKDVSVQDLLGIYYFRHFSLWTVVDTCRRGLRSRLCVIQADSVNPNPYRLTTE